MFYCVSNLLVTSLRWIIIVKLLKYRQHFEDIPSNPIPIKTLPKPLHNRYNLPSPQNPKFWRKSSKPMNFLWNNSHFFVTSFHVKIHSIIRAWGIPKEFINIPGKTRKFPRSLKFTCIKTYATGDTCIVPFIPIQNRNSYNAVAWVQNFLTSYLLIIWFSRIERLELWKYEGESMWKLSEVWMRFEKLAVKVSIVLPWWCNYSFTMVYL